MPDSRISSALFVLMIDSWAKRTIFNRNFYAEMVYNQVSVNTELLHK